MMAKKPRRGRPIGSRNIRVTPEFRKEPDIEKLGRALIAVAMRIAEKKAAEEQSSSVSGKGDGMP